MIYIDTHMMLKIIYDHDEQWKVDNQAGANLLWNIYYKIEFNDHQPIKK